MPATRQDSGKMMPPPPPPPTFDQVEQAALRILRLISDTPGLENTTLAVVGDLALYKYLACEVPIHSIDFIVSKSSSPGRVRKEIASHPMSPLIERAGSIFFPLSPKGAEIEVKIVPDWLCPFLPSAARPARKDTENLPYISLSDLLVFKVDACGLRERETSKRKEALDATALLELASEHFPLQLDETKLDKIKQGLHEVLEYVGPEHDKSWWQRRLGQVPDKQRTPTEIFSDLAAADRPTTSSSAAATPPASPGASVASSSRSSIYSTMSRTSSSTSSLSMHSTASSVSTVHSVESPSKNGRPRKMSATATKSPRHKRHISSSGPQPTSIESALERLEIGRPASPGVGLINKI